MKHFDSLDYSKKENWIVNENDKSNTDYDLFYLSGTAILEPGQENGVGTNFEQMRFLGGKNYSLVGDALNDDARVFCPIQRQMSLSYALNYVGHEVIFKEIYEKEPYADLCAALDYYFEHYNINGEKPFVLAGHSQGAASMQVLLEQYFLKTDKRKYLKNLVCLYSLGYGIRKSWFENLPNNNGLVHFADGEDDYHSVVSWNVEGAGEKGVSFLLADEGEETLVINPLNWKKDATYAPKSLNKGVYLDKKNPDDTMTYFFSHDEKDLFDAQIDVKRGSVITNSCTNYIALPVGPSTPVWGGKSLHNYDARGYYFNLKENVRKRVNNFLKAKGEK